MRFVLLPLLNISILVSAYAQETDKAGRIMHYALAFLGKPYVAHTLETECEEHLIMNLNAVDCTTYVEYAVALTLAEGDTLCARDYLRHIRYRNGMVDGYASRLHYITEWIKNGVKNGFFKELTAMYSPDTLTIQLSFMSSHPAAYKYLKDSPEHIKQIKTIEQNLSGHTVHYLPKSRITRKGLPWIKDGDILCITTDIPGLDIVHLGFACYRQGQLHLLHASSSGKKILISQKPLADMFSHNKTWTGVRVLRVVKKVEDLHFPLRKDSNYQRVVAEEL